VFGQRSWIQPAGTGANDDWQRWTMFTHDVAGTAPVEAQLGIFLPAGLPVSEGPPVEDVLMVRDEAANMEWGIERTVWLGTGTPMPGEEAARETLAYRVRLHPQADGLEPVAAIAYEAMNTVPENGLDAGEPYQVHEEEVPRAGTRFTSAFRRTRGADVQPVIWLGIRRATGRGEASSGLDWDRIVNTR
jgi:hypothetical protein